MYYKYVFLDSLFLFFDCTPGASAPPNFDPRYAAVPKKVPFPTEQDFCVIESDRDAVVVSGRTKVKVAELSRRKAGVKVKGDEPDPYLQLVELLGLPKDKPVAIFKIMLGARVGKRKT